MTDQDTPNIGFGSVQLLKTSTLGNGSYGSVCKAKCDDLLCAAKIIHPTLIVPTDAKQQSGPHREHRQPFKRFQQECQFMSAIKHPNIVQCLGTHQDPETGLPVLLMELMDDNLTQFLNSSQHPVPYHIQVNFCHDITLAISYLHSNGIIHRDLSSNNILLRGIVIAKVADFGMAKLLDEKRQASQLVSNTKAPGTPVYMPPEAVIDKPVYTGKIDCFAIGVLIIQIVTRQCPNPSKPFKCIQEQPTIRESIPEIERRQNHISQVDPNHPLLPIALHCLKDSDVERPSAQELCYYLEALKETPQYTENVSSAQERRPEQDVRSQPKTRRPGNVHKSEKEQRIIKCLPVKGKTAPCIMSRGSADAVTHGDKVYITPNGTKKIYVYNSKEDTWDSDGLPDCLFNDCALAVVNNLLTTIGGRKDTLLTNELYSLTEEFKGSSRKWSKEFPPMPTKRTKPTAMCNGKWLIVAGGEGFFTQTLRTVEVMHVSRQQWNIAADLPESVQSSTASATIYGDSIYMLDGNDSWTTVYTCSLADLFLSCRPARSIGEQVSRFLILSPDERPISIWNEVTGFKAAQSTCVTFHGELLAIGGKDSNGKPTSDIRVYNATDKQWEIISKMTEPRHQCFAAFLPSNKIMVVGGHKDSIDMLNFYIVYTN